MAVYKTTEVDKILLDPNFARNFSVDDIIVMSEKFNRYTIFSEDSPGCILWTGSFSAPHQPRTSIRKTTVASHKLLYRLRVGPYPARSEMIRVCRNSDCMNEDHLHPVLGADNPYKIPLKDREEVWSQIRLAISARTPIRLIPPILPGFKGPHPDVVWQEDKEDIDEWLKRVRGLQKAGFD